MSLFMPMFLYKVEKILIDANKISTLIQESNIT